MKQRTVTIVVLSALLCAAIVVYLSRHTTVVEQPLASETILEVSDQRKSPTPVVPRTLTPNQGTLPEEARDKTEAIEGEAILTFSSETELDRFVAGANVKGWRILDINRPLRSIRLSLANTDREAARSLAGENASIEDNYTVLVPFPVAPDYIALGPAFEEHALSFLGVSQNNASWGEGVTVAVLDTGITPHPTLEGVSISHLDLINAEAQGADTYGFHGTAVASLIAGHNGNGIAPGADLLSIRVLDSDGIGDSFTLAKGIVEAVDRGAQVINMSLGSFGYNQTLANAVSYADTRGVVLIASAGNEGAPLLPFPAQIESVVAVSAIDALGHHAGFSNQGSRVDLAAPGVGVYAAADGEAWISFTGTSAAAPYVAGSVAALLSQDPNLTASEAVKRLIENANDTGSPGADEQTGAGFIDLSRALRSPQSAETDLALADIFFTPGDRAVTITAQNRGTEIVRAATLALVTNDGLPQTIQLSQLAPGEVASHTVSVDRFLVTPEDELRIQATVNTNAAQADAKPRNDTRAVLVPYTALPESATP